MIEIKKLHRSLDISTPKALLTETVGETMRLDLVDIFFYLLFESRINGVSSSESDLETVGSMTTDTSWLIRVIFVYNRDKLL